MTVQCKGAPSPSPFLAVVFLTLPATNQLGAADASAVQFESFEEFWVSTMANPYLESVLESHSQAFCTLQFLTVLFVSDQKLVVYSKAWE